MRKVTEARLPTIRAQLVWLLAAVALPLIALSLWAAWKHYQDRRAEVGEGLLSEARLLSSAADRELAAARGVLETLAASPLLTEGRLDAFHRLAADIAASRPEGQILLTAPNGQQLVNTLRRWGEPLPNVFERAQLPSRPDELPVGSTRTLRDAIETGRTQYSDLFVGIVAQRPLLTIETPVTREGRVTSVLTLSIPPSGFQAMVREQKLPVEKEAGLIDRRGFYIARARDAKLVGRPVGERFRREAMSGATEGIGEAESRRGEPVIYAYARSPTSGWTAAVSITEAAALAPLNRAMRQWAIAAAALIALGAAAALWLGRRIASPMHRLAQAAAGTPLGGEIEVPRVHTQELARLAEAVQRFARRSDERFRLATDAFPALISYVDRDLRYQLVNRSYEEWFGRPRENIVGRSLPEVLGAQSYEVLRPHVETALSGRTATFELRVPYKDGGERYVQATYVPDIAEDGAVRGFFGLVLDVTDSKKTEEALRASERLLRAATSGARAGIVVVNERYEYLFANEAYAEALGLPPGNIVGRHVHEVVAAGWSQIKPRLDRALAGERVTYELSLPGRWVAVIYEPQRVEGEAQVVVVVVDITQRRQMEEALRESDRRKDEFLATLAHELRNPLAPIVTSLELIKRARGNAGLEEQAREIMERQVAHMARLIDDLLDVSRITRDRLELRRERVELGSIVRQAVESVRPMIARAGQDLELELPREPVYLNADPARLAQVLGNLLGNAAKFSAQGARIRLAAERQGGEVLVRVTDTGIGIPADMLSRVFDMFTQVDSSLERAHGGLGIGLTLVKRLVEMHGGAVTAHSEGPGRGSEFRVRLPALSGKPAEVRPAAEPAQRDAAQLRILVVDDNRDAAESLATLLRVTGHEAQSAHDGAQALQKARELRFDAILLDIGMPELNGYETCRALRAQPGGDRVAIVALTGWGQQEDRRKSEEAGFDAHLVKPVEHGALVELIAAFKRA